MKKPTSKDVAQLANVSQSIVSMILNKKENVSFSEETVEKVLQAAKQLNYQIPRDRKNKKAAEQRSTLLPAESGGL